MATPNPDLEELYRRAIADPQSITRAERNAIRDWPPPEEEDRLCIAKTGRTRAELIAKAFASPDDLTRDEAMIVHHPQGVRFDADANLSVEERREHLKRRRIDPSPMKALQDEAERQLRVAAGEEEKAALLNAVKRQFAIDNAKQDAWLQYWREQDAARRLRSGTPWIKHMLENGLLEDSAECWGFVIFRTGCYNGEEGEAAWRKFREYFAKAAETSVLHWNSGPLLWPKFRAVFVEDKEELDDASNEQLRARFRKMRDGDGGEHLTKGIRTSCFLVADRAAIESEAAKMLYVAEYDDDLFASVYIRPEDPVAYVRAVDPDYEAPAAAAEEKKKEGGKDEAEGDEAGTSDKAEPAATAEAKKEAEKEDDEMAGFKGEATVALPRVFDWLHYVCFSAERGISAAGLDLREGWRAIYVQTKTPEAWIRNLASNSGSLLYAHVPRATLL
ncbi:hypothetical protein QBC46DRAFT_392626 [Diplogelasinospora grovesii]|uniref:Uncharacterized protein n=1 Tax=Diplogelasinospora grovesii TaxID=303347 RepID=A0AAN6N1S7_9PEZI|nr:hypothetical protein QBC46DRAFT_392626 [Diplogelasinospora grovesii]